MKSIFLALALIATGVHAAEDTDSTPCDGIENDKQTLECATYNKTTAEQLLKDNYQGLLERMGSTYGSDKSKLADITARLKDAQQKWEKLRDADCAVDTFPAVTGTKAYAIELNDCLARMSDERSGFWSRSGRNKRQSPPLSRDPRPFMKTCGIEIKGSEAIIAVASWITRR
jgi:uncharacterized protein YecT (DUF1311 family)